MSYTPINWQAGDTITAEKLNKMDPGLGTSAAQLFSETVTTESSEYGNEVILAYSEFIEAPSILVSFDGTDYECERIATEGDGVYCYGGFSSEGPDFTDYPFLILSNDFHNTNIVYTDTAGTHTVSVTANTIETSDDFTNAVKKIVNPMMSMMPMLCINGVTTYDEMVAARDSGSLLYFYRNSVCHFITYFYEQVSPTAVDALPAGSSESETFGFNDDMIFTIYLNNA